MNNEEYLAQVPPSQSILNDITDNDLADAMNQPRDLVNTINSWDDLIEVVSRKCPGLQFIVRQYTLACKKLNEIIYNNKKEFGEDVYCSESVRLEKYIAQLKVMFNVLVLIHNKEEVKRLEDMFSYEEEDNKSDK